MGKSRVRNFLRPPSPQERVKPFAPPLLKCGNFWCPPYNMAKTSSYRVILPQNLLCPHPPFSMAKTCPAPPPLLSLGVKPQVPPLTPRLPFCIASIFKASQPFSRRKYSARSVWLKTSISNHIFFYPSFTSYLIGRKKPLTSLSKSSCDSKG